MAHMDALLYVARTFLHPRCCDDGPLQLNKYRQRNPQSTTPVGASHSVPESHPVASTSKLPPLAGQQVVQNGQSVPNRCSFLRSSSNHLAKIATEPPQTRSSVHRASTSHPKQFDESYTQQASTSTLQHQVCIFVNTYKYI